MSGYYSQFEQDNHSIADSAFGYVRTKTCPVCGKKFTITVKEHCWAYHQYQKKTGACVCSYSCMRSSRFKKPDVDRNKTMPEEKTKRYRTESTAMQMVEDFIEYYGCNAAFVARLIGVSWDDLSRWRRGIRTPNERSSERIKHALLSFGTDFIKERDND